MTDRSRGGIYVVNPATGEAEPITSEELLVMGSCAAEPEPVKQVTAKRESIKPEELKDGAKS